MTNNLMFIISYFISLLIFAIVPFPNNAWIALFLILYSATIYLGHIIKTK